MMPRLLALLAVPGFLALGSATASAQAPGESYYAAPGETAPVAPVVVVPRPGRDPMAHRFALGVQFGGMGIAPEDAGEDMQTEFKTAELQVRFRATRRLEIFLAFTGGRQTIDDDDGDERDGDLAMDQITLGARFSFRPASRWNWYLMAGFGSTLIAPHDTPEELRDDLRRPHGMFGIGIERRWTHFALQAELRGISVAEREDEDMTLPADSGWTSDPSMSSEELGGGQFTVGASYYF